MKMFGLFRALVKAIGWRPPARQTCFLTLHRANFPGRALREEEEQVAVAGHADGRGDVAGVVAAALLWAAVVVGEAHLRGVGRVWLKQKISSFLTEWIHREIIYLVLFVLNKSRSVHNIQRSLLNIRKKYYVALMYVDDVESDVICPKNGLSVYEVFLLTMYYLNLQ